MNKFLFRLKANWSTCCWALMKPKATRSSRIISSRMKTNLAIERCEPRLALDASQVPEGQPLEVIFLDVVPETTQFGTVTSAAIGHNDFINVSNDGLTNPVKSFIVRNLSLNDIVADGHIFNNRQENFYNIAAPTSTNDGSAVRVGGLTADFSSGEISIFIVEVSSNDSAQGSLTSLSSFEPTEISLVGEKQPKLSEKGSSLTTSLSKHRHTDPAVLHVSSLQTVPFDSARPVFRADQAFTIFASDDGTQAAMPQSQMARGEPSSTGFLDVQATVAEIDSAQKTRVNALVFDHENGSPLFEENGLHGNTNLMPVMARATLFEVAEHRVPLLPREVLGGHDGQKKSTNREKAVASTTLPQDILLASGDSADWATRDLSLYVRLSLAAAFATTTFQIEKRNRSTNVSGIKADDTSAKQKRVLR